MKVAPFRALTHCRYLLTFVLILRGNEGRPFQGIDTNKEINGLIGLA